MSAVDSLMAKYQAQPKQGSAVDALMAKYQNKEDIQQEKPSWVQENIIAPISNIAEGYGKGSADLVGGTAQFATDIGGYIAPETFDSIRGLLADAQALRNKAYAQKTEGSTLAPIAEVASYLPAALAMPAASLRGGAAGIAKGVAALAGQGAAFGATAPSEVQQTPEEALAKRAEGAGAGAATSVALGSVLSGIGSVANKIKAGNVAEEAARQGITLPSGALTGSRTIQGLESGLSSLPFADTRIAGSYNKALSQIDDVIKSNATSLAPVKGATTTGITVQKGIGDFVKNFTNKTEQLSNNVYSHFAPTEQLPAINTRIALDDIIGKYQNPELSSVMSKPRFEKISQALDNNGNALTLSDLRQLRTSLGKEANDASLVSDVPKGEIKKLYGALSQDLKEAALSKGGQAAKDWNRFNSFYSSGRNRIDTFLNNIANVAEPEKIARSLIAEKEGATRLTAVMRSLQPEERNILRSQIISNLGKAKAGAQDAGGEVFSANTFLTNWNNLSPNAKNILFNNKQLSQNMNDIAKIVSNVKEGGKLANTSNTAKHLVVAGAVTGGVGAVGGMDNAKLFLKGLAVGTLGARLLTNPSFAKWLATGSKITNSGNLAGHIAKLGALAKREPDLAPDIKEYMNNLNQEQ